MILNNCQKKPRIDYPCSWTYRVIGSDEAMIREAIAEVLAGRQALIMPSNRSSGGKYLCLKLETVVDDEAGRNALYQALREHPAVRMVL